MARLHIAESHKDVTGAQHLADRLRALGNKVSIDVESLVPGVEWLHELRGQLGAADGLVVLLTERSVETPGTRITSQWIAADIGAARATGKFVVPVIVGNEVMYPALVDDLFTIRVASLSRRDIDDAARQVNAAARVHMARRAAEARLDLPPGFSHLAPHVLRFHEDAPFDSSVFVMMKFPDPKRMEAKHQRLLAAIFDTVETTLRAHDLHARRADEGTYHNQLWENICVHLLGCKYGLAILEDRVARELNPNVALEYGFMAAMNRPVALFRDVSFKSDRADLTGKLAKPFTIDQSGTLRADTLQRAITDWMRDLGIRRQTRKRARSL